MKRYSTHEKRQILNDVAATVASGRTVSFAMKEHRIWPAVYYRWKKELNHSIPKTIVSTQTNHIKDKTYFSVATPFMNGVVGLFVGSPKDLKSVYSSIFNS